MVRVWFLAVLFVSATLLGVASFPDRTLTVHFLDVGQGDAIFIQGPTGIQVLIDGGPTPAVLRELGRSMPFYDRSIDAVVATHPDLDHIGGLVDVFRRYRVSVFLESGATSQTTAFRALGDEVAAQGIAPVVAERGMRLVLGGGAYADVLYPHSNTPRVRGNDASIIIRVVYGDTAVLLTGDAPAYVERELASLYGDFLRSTILKVGHHGSKTSTAQYFVQSVQPVWSVISASKDNRYGHPHKEVLDTLMSEGSVVLGTYDRSTIRFASNGSAFILK